METYAVRNPSDPPFARLNMHLKLHIRMSRFMGPNMLCTPLRTLRAHLRGSKCGSSFGPAICEIEHALEIAHPSVTIYGPKHAVHTPSDPACPPLWLEMRK